MVAAIVTARNPPKRGEMANILATGQVTGSLERHVPLERQLVCRWQVAGACWRGERCGVRQKISIQATVLQPPGPKAVDYFHGHFLVCFRFMYILWNIFVHLSTLY